MVGKRLRLVTGWSLLIAAVGICIDSWATTRVLADWLEPLLLPAGPASGSIGLIPAYLGATVGLICLGFVAYRVAGVWAGVFMAAGVASTFVFWFSYPANATWGGLGSIVIGTVVLFLPGLARLASPVWVASGTLGIPELVRPGVAWGPIASFTLLGLAIGLTGAYVLWGMESGASLRLEHPSDEAVAAS